MAVGIPNSTPSSIPSDPTLTDIIIQGMREGGQYTVTSSQQAYTDFVTYQWATIKTEMWNACRTDRMLESDTCIVCNPGASVVALPADFDSEVSLWIYDADTTFRGTAQTGDVASITLASTFTDTNADLLGRYIFTIGGTGSGQVRQITGYNDSTKLVTVDANWTTPPDNTTQYLIQVIRTQLHRKDHLRPAMPSRRPQYYMRVGTKLLVYPAADQVYPVLLTYRSNLTRLDDAGTLFTKHLRERRHLWVQGVKVKTMARYDDDRYEQEKQIWEQMLIQYGRQNVVYERMEINR